jgi:hypothetical protein
MACKYFAPNGNPSKLFDSLYSVMQERYPNDPAYAEKEAVRTWMMTRSDNFKNWFGNWENNEWVIKTDNDRYYGTFTANSKEEAIEMASKETSTARGFTAYKKEVDFSKVVDENGEPLVVFHGSRLSNNINEFKNPITFTSTDKNYSLREFAFNKKENVYPLFLNIRNPLNGDKEGKHILNSPNELANEFISPPLIKEWLGKHFDGVYGTDSYGDASGTTNGKTWVSFEKNQIKSIDNIGYFSTESDNIKAMQDTRGYQRSYRSSKKSDLFNFSSVNVESLAEGKRNISIRKENMKSGVYRFQGNYYKVTNRGFRKISEIKENKDALRSRAIENDMPGNVLMQEFYNNKLSMYIYDVKKIDDKDFAPKAMEADGGFLGDIDADRTETEVDSDVFNSYIAAVTDHINILYEERKKKKGDLKAVQDYSDRIKIQEDILARLEENKSVRSLIDIGIEQLDEVSQYAMSSTAELEDIDEGIRIAQAWSKLNETVNLLYDPTNSDQDSELIEAGRKLQGDAQAILTTLLNRTIEKITELAANSGTSLDKKHGVWIEDGQVRIRDIDFLGSKSISGAFSSNPLEITIDVLCSAQTNKSNDEHYEFLRDRDATTKRLLGKKNADTRFLVEQFDIDVVDPDTGETTKQKRQGIISMYDRKFYNTYNDLHTKAKTGEIEFSEFYEFEKKHFDYKLTPEGQAQFENYIEQRKAEYVEGVNPQGEYIYDEEGLQQLRDRYDPQIFLDSLVDDEVTINSGGVWLTKVPKNIPENPAYTRLSSAEKEYHAWFTNQFVDAYVNHIFDSRIGQSDIDQLVLSFSTNMTEGLTDKAKYLGNAATDFLKNSFFITVNSTKSSAINRPLTNNSEIKAVFRPVSDFLPENGMIDPLEVLSKFKAASIAYKHKQKIEETLNVINDLAATATRQEQNNSGLDISKKAGGLLGTRSSTNLAERINYTIKDYLQGTGNDKNTGRKGATPGSTSFSVGQTFDSINSMTRFRFMALSPLSAAGNFMMGAMNNFTYAADGRYFTTMELTRASWMMKWSPMNFAVKNLSADKLEAATPEAKLIAELMYRYNMLGDVTEELTYGGSALARFFALQKGGEFLVQGAAALAQMLHQKVNFKDGSEGKTMLDLYSLDENNRIIFKEELLADDSPFKQVENVHLFFDKIKAVNDKIHGDYRHALAGKKTVYGRMLFMFRTWLPMAVKERFGAEYEHRLLGTQKGRYISAGGLLKWYTKDKDGSWHWRGDTAFNFAKTLAKILLPVIGRKIKLGGDISEVDRHNIEMTVREVQMFMILISAAALSKMQMNDDEDDNDDEMHFLNYLYNQSNRLESELSMYIMPSSFNQIIKNMVPLTSTLTDAEKMVTAYWNYLKDPESDTYTRGFRKGDSKAWTKTQQFFPIMRSYQSVWSSFSQLYNQNPR